MIKKMGENNFRKKGKNQSRDSIEREVTQLSLGEEE